MQTSFYELINFNKILLGAWFGFLELILLLILQCILLFFIILFICKSVTIGDHRERDQINIIEILKFYLKRLPLNRFLFSV